MNFGNYDSNMWNQLLFFFANPQNETDKAQFDRLKWEQIWFGALSNILTGIFTYENVDSALVRRIEKSFFNSVYVGAYKDNEFGIVVAPCMPSGKQNSWGEYSGYDIILPTGKHKKMKLDDMVVGYNYYINNICDSVLCWHYAQSLTEVELSIENAVILSRYTALMEVPSQNAVNEVLQKFTNYKMGNPVVIAKNRPEDKYGTLNFVDPNKLDDYYNGLRDKLNEFLTITGLSSLVNPNKKERLITDEITSNDDIKNTLLSNRIQNRFDFIENINEKFGTDFKVSVDDKIFSTINDVYNMIPTNGEGGVKNASE